MELVATGNYADTRIGHDLALTARLPGTLAGMAAGLISGARADVIAGRTAILPDADAALEMKLDPDGVKARKERAKQTRQRVEARREHSGNASLSGRELDTVDALASKAYIDAIAVRIRNSGLAEGTLPSIRPRVNLRAPNAEPEPASASAGNGGGADPGPDYPDDLDELDGFDDSNDFDDPDAPVLGYAGPDGAPAWTPDEADKARHGHPNQPDDLPPRRGPLRPGETALPPAANSETLSARGRRPATPPAATPKPPTPTSTTPPPTPTARPASATSAPKCRRHHRAKQAPGWRVEQPEPGTIHWTLPNGRTHTTHPTIYDI